MLLRPQVGSLAEQLRECIDKAMLTVAALLALGLYAMRAKAIQVAR